MVHITFLSVLALLILQCTAVFKPSQRTWKYEGQVHVNNVASGDENPLSAVWGVRGRLISQNFEDHVVLKLKDVQTTIRNGYEASLSLGDENIYKDVRPDSGAILKPIIVYFGDVKNITVVHEADDPVWSVNMKRGIFSSYISIADGTDSPVPQHTLYGICNVTYTVSNVGSDYNAEKTIDHDSCENGPAYYFSTRQWNPSLIQHTPETTETTYTYSYNGEVNIQNLRKIHSHSVVRYQSVPGVKSVQRVTQTKNIVFLSQTDSFEKFDTSSINVYSNLTFDYSKGFEGNRNAGLVKKPAAQLIENFNEYFDQFQEYFNAVPLRNFELGSVNDSITYMFDALHTMNTNTLQQLSTDIFAKNNNLYQHMFLSFLPYLGTEDSIRFIKSLIENEDENLNDLLAIKILATFPTYLYDHSEALLKDMEPLMNLNVSNSQVKYAGILSFASLLADMNGNGVLDNQTYRKYVSLYYKNFEEATEYEIKMTYLLGLINMNGDFTDDMIVICTDSNLSHHLRVLAIYGFKKFLKSEGNIVYEFFWPIVKSHTEHYEVRVASLDLILHSDISYTQFQSIVNWYHDEFENPDEQHLANYLYTTIQSLEKSIGYYEYLGVYATDALETMKPIKNDRVWTTGNYRMAFTDNDANVGGSLQARLIANPNTNVINVGIFSLDSFAVSLNLGSYTAYVKTEGIPDATFIFAYINNRDNENPVQHLIDLIKKHGYKIKDFEGAHIEVVLFCDNRVVFGMHIDKDNIDNYAENPLFLDLLKLVVDYNSLSYPLREYTYLVSDLGTGIQISHDAVQIESYELENFHKILYTFDSSEETDAIEYNLKYRSIWAYTLSVECYNPLVEASIETYKFAKEESLVNIPYSFNLTDFVFKWKHTRDSLNWVRDHVIGTYVDPIVVQLYCDSCESITALPTGEKEEQVYKSKGIEIEPIIGVHFNITISQKSDEQRYLDSIEPETFPSYSQIIRSHKTNTVSVPFAKPVLLFWHIDLYSTYLADDISSISMRTEPYYNEPTETVFDLEIDTNDIKYDRDPISREEFDFSIALTNRKSHNAEVLNYFNATVIYKEKSESPDSETQPHIEHSYDIKLYYDNGKDKKYKICIDREVQYPNRRVDKFSLEPVDPTRAISKIQFGNVQQISDACPITDSVTVTEFYTATEKQKQRLESSEEHDRCKTQSNGFKFVPPTTDCLAAHKIISQYDACTVYADFTKVTVPAGAVILTEGEFGMKVLEYKRLNETHVTVALSKKIIESVFEKIMNPAENQIDVKNPGGLMSMSPSVIAYDDQDLQFGLGSVCYITPNEIQTFHGKIIKNYNTEFGPDAVGLVECINNTQVGLTIQRLGDNSIGFNLWSENNTFVASVQDGKAKVVYNGQERSETDIKDEDIKIYFLDQNVIYVTNGLLDIQYTTEYITVKAPSIYSNYICGLCSGDKK